MTRDDIVRGIREPGKFDATVGSEDKARGLVREALPDAVELPAGRSGAPYARPPRGARRWFQVHPPEPDVGNDLPHVKYEDWNGGKKGRGGRWGHIFFPPETS